MANAMQLAGWQIALWAVVLVIAVAMTTLAVLKAIGPSAGSEPDAAFWNTFTGLMVIVPALVIPALGSPLVGLLLLSLAVGTAAAAVAGRRKLDRIRQERPANRPGFQAASERHGALLQRWQGYELDAAKAIDYPGMIDVRLPETAALIRCLEYAEQCRITPGTDYPKAVEQLEEALTAAEMAAGVPGEDVPPARTTASAPRTIPGAKTIPE
ncbi:hypothetical protein [Arthrobacter sp. ISL-30]|uniref:hypothetical protein n=1 Tax=Arthrobacter sp. ISL-30 TaxID=2819109 RepID=UPI001BE7EE27|nr:hypothetical protein [Arthrobacter sp. ISL-30]MBT2514911.1 hypothetical protein [Arthrobacter sp. ISL-30]